MTHLNDTYGKPLGMFDSNKFASNSGLESSMRPLGAVEQIRNIENGAVLQ